MNQRSQIRRPSRRRSTRTPKIAPLRAAALEGAPTLLMRPRPSAWRRRRPEARSTAQQGYEPGMSRKKSWCGAVPRATPKEKPGSCLERNLEDPGGLRFGLPQVSRSPRKLRSLNRDPTGLNHQGLVFSGFSMALWFSLGAIVKQATGNKESGKSLSHHKNRPPRVQV